MVIHSRNKDENISKIGDKEIRVSDKRSLTHEEVINLSKISIYGAY